MKLGQNEENICYREMCIFTTGVFEELHVSTGVLKSFMFRTVFLKSFMFQDFCSALNVSSCKLVTCIFFFLSTLRSSDVKDLAPNYSNRIGFQG